SSSNVQSGPSLSRLLSLMASSKIVVIAHLFFANRLTRKTTRSGYLRLHPEKGNPKKTERTQQ
ncbi:MAG: hypothetical protein ABN483_10820, partial [Pantoea agglomerans]